MKELIGKEVQFRGESHTVTEVNRLVNFYGNTVGYRIETDNEDLLGGHDYPDSGRHGVDEFIFPQEYMDDIKQARRQEKIFEKKNNKRRKQLVSVPVKERIQNRFNETNGEIIYKLSLGIIFMFYRPWPRSSVLLKVGHESGSIEIPAQSDSEKISAQMSAEEIAEFFAIYESFDFFAMHKRDVYTSYRWVFNCTICDGETYCSNFFPCSKEKNEDRLLTEYARKIFEKYLPAEDYVTLMNAFESFERDS
jgi:hypothetical protein